MIGQVFYSQEVPVDAPPRLHSNFSTAIVMPQPVQAAPASTVTLSKAIAAIKVAKTVSNRRKIYIIELDRVLRQFAKGRENRPLESITAQEIEDYLAVRKYSPTSYLSAVGRIATLFEFAKRKRWLKVNPAEQIEKPYCDWKTPFIFTPEQCETLVRHCQKEWPERLLYLSLCLFAGVRPNEARQIKPSDITGETLRIEAGISKVRQPRIVHLHPTAVLWIKHALPKAQAPFSETLRKRWTKAFAKAMGFKDGWPQDACRHTCCSYWLAERQDVGWLAMQLGNSSSIIFKHYRQICTNETAQKFWSILP